MRHAGGTIVIALCGAVLSLWGCGGGDDADSTADRTATPATTSAAEETGTPTPAPTAEGGTEEVETGDAVAEQTVKARGARETTIDMAVMGLQVDGELATLTVSFTVHDPEAAPDDDYSLYELNDQQPLYVTLLDPVNLKRYQVVKDSDGNALQSGAVETHVPLDASATAQYTFAAPPADVTEIDVAVGDWPAFRDVPIER